LSWTRWPSIRVSRPARWRGLSTALASVAATLAVSALSACGVFGAGADLHVLVSFNSAQAADQRAWFAHIAEAFKARTGATVAFDTFASAGDEQTKLQTAMVSGTGPDIYSLGSTFTPVAYASGGFHVLSEPDWQRIGGRDRFSPAALATCGPDPQHVIGVPTSVRPYGMVYNTALFRAAHIDSPPATWDEFVADAKRLTNPATGVYGTAVDYADPYNPWKYIWTFALQSGGRMISADQHRAELDSPLVSAAVGRYFDLLTAHHIVDPASVGWKSAQAAAAFASGKAAMLPMVTPQIERTLDKSQVKGSYAYAPLPLVPFGATELPLGGIAAGSIGSGDNMVIADYTKHLDLALEFISLVTSTPEQMHYNQVFGDLPSVTEAENQLVATRPNAAGYAAAQRTAVPTDFTGAWSSVQIGLTNVTTQSLPALAGGGYDPAEVRALLARANQTVQTALARAEAPR